MAAQGMRGASGPDLAGALTWATSSNRGRWVKFSAISTRAPPWHHRAVSSSLWALALLLGAAGPDAKTSSDWTPATAPPPTAWARAGARSWRACDELGKKALAARLSGPRGSAAVDKSWRLRMERCPGEPEVLIVAAQEQILESARAGWLPEQGARLDDVAERHQTALAEAVGWLDRALVESGRRGQEEPFEARYLRAYASLAAGDFVAARKDLRKVMERGDVERWRLERMASVVELLGGDLDTALRYALLGVIDAPPEDAMISRYIWALVLDRAGAPTSSTEMFRYIRRSPGYVKARQAVETFLPIHERLYLRAVEHQANGEDSNAIRLWDAYLSRPEPEEPDRALAQRHKAEL